MDIQVKFTIHSNVSFFLIKPHIFAADANFDLLISFLIIKRANLSFD